MKLRLVFAIQPNGVFETAQEVRRRKVPDARHSLVDVRSTGGDHLIGDFDEKRRQSLGGVVVRRNAVDDAN